MGLVYQAQEVKRIQKDMFPKLSQVPWCIIMHVHYVRVPSCARILFNIVQLNKGDNKLTVSSWEGLLDI